MVLRLKDNLLTLLHAMFGEYKVMPYNATHVVACKWHHTYTVCDIYMLRGPSL